MNAAPEVSVVMSVYNGAAKVNESIASVLSQDGVDFEFIIVNDGSTDASGRLLEETALADKRIRVLHQENRGLTRALIRGCDAARGKFIARQDCGDVSLPGRLSSELGVMQSQPGVALVSCGARFVGPKGEDLFETVIDGSDATARLLTSDIERIRGPAHHGSAFFRRDLYEHLGGYREQFYFAQDLDLWTRMAEKGRHVAIPQVLYAASFELDSISSVRRDQQIAYAKVILECARLRREGLDESPALAKAAAIIADRTAKAPSDRAAALYFVGACLRNRSDPRAKKYFRDAWRANRLHLKSAIRLLTG